MNVTLGQQLLSGLSRLRALLLNWDKAAHKRLELAYRRIGHIWRAESVKRVPVNEGNLVQKVLTNTYWQGGEIVTETGTNVRRYPEYLEFGTRFIAGGAVLRLGDGPNITDAQAIKSWPAKDALSLSVRPGRPEEQMPWLRPAWNDIEPWAMQEIEDALTPPGASTP